MSDTTLLEKEKVVGFTIIIPSKRSGSEIAIRGRLPEHARMKFVPDETVSDVIKNEPMPRVSRVNDIPDSAEVKEELLRQLLRMLFPEMVHFGADYSITGHDDSGLNTQINETKVIYQKSGMMKEMEIIDGTTKRFKAMRGGLEIMLKEDLVNRSSIIPIEYLPDMFMATPVWYWYSNSQNLNKIKEFWRSGDPEISNWIVDFCRLFPKSQQWMDTFQMFNYRLRGLDRYNGEIIPLDISKRMVKASEFFDYVVVTTPYHDQVGLEWEQLKWERAIDPYLLAFKKGIPFFFVLGRFSGTGTFPLFNELIGDTIEFLRSHRNSLSGFNGLNRYWDKVGLGTSSGTGQKHGDYLKKHVDVLLKAFEQGTLFDWLRGDAELSRA